MSQEAIEAKLLRLDLILAGLNPEIVDLVAPPVSATPSTPFPFKFSESVIDDGEQNYWPKMTELAEELL